jgi:hypothetical protein
MQPFSHCRGQAILEGLWGLLALLLVGAMLLHVIYYAASREFVRFVGREALVCMLETDNRILCENTAQLRLSHAIGRSRPYIRLGGQGRQRKTADLSYRPESAGGTVESAHMSLSTRWLLP